MNLITSAERCCWSVDGYSLPTRPGGGGFEVAGFTLFSSHLGREGATYTAEADYPLLPRGTPALGPETQGAGV